MYKICHPSLSLFYWGSEKPLGTVGGSAGGWGWMETLVIHLHCRRWAPPSPWPEHGPHTLQTTPQTTADLGTFLDLLLCLRHYLLFEESELIKTKIKTQQVSKGTCHHFCFSQHKWHHSFNSLLDIVIWMFNNVLNFESKIPPNPLFPKTLLL